MILKILNSESIKPRKSVVWINCDKEEYSNRAELVGRDGIDGNEVNNNKVKKNYQKISKSKRSSKSKKTIRSLDFLILELN